MSMDKEKFINNYKPFGNDMIFDLVDTFQKDYPNKISKLREACQYRDFDSINKLSHSIKGSLGIFYDNDTRELAYQLELAGKGEDSSQIDELFQNWKILSENSMKIFPN